jgi:hypothetical protein
VAAVLCVIAGVLLLVRSGSADPHEVPAEAALVGE